MAGNTGRSGGQIGNRNAASGRPWKAAIEFALKKHKKNGRHILQEIAERVIDLAVSGDKDAIREIADRLDGRPTTQIDMGVTVSDSISRQFELAEARRRSARGLREIKTVDGATILVDGNDRPVTPEFAQALLARLEAHRNPEKLVTGEVMQALEHKAAPAGQNDFDQGRLDDLTASEAEPSPVKTMTFIEAMARKAEDDACEFA